MVVENLDNGIEPIGFDRIRRDKIVELIPSEPAVPLADFDEVSERVVNLRFHSSSPSPCGVSLRLPEKVGVGRFLVRMVFRRETGLLLFHDLVVFSVYLMPLHPKWHYVGDFVIAVCWQVRLAFQIPLKPF